MGPHADDVADSLGALWEHLGAALDAGWTRREGGAVLAVSGAPESSLNGVWVLDDDARAESVDALIDEVAATGLPHCLQLRPGAGDDVAALAAARGMAPDDDVPLMCATAPSALEPGGFAIRELVPGDAPLHVAVAALGFGVKPEVFGLVVTDRVLAAEGVRAYVAEARGEAVATGVGVTLGASVGIFNVATPEAHRRRGYGAAITARAAADGLAAGASYAWLQSSPMAEALYARLGFRTLERWRCWVSDGSS